MSDASSPQVRDHETRRRKRERGREIGRKKKREGRTAWKRESEWSETTIPLDKRARTRRHGAQRGRERRGRQGGKGPSRGGRRSNEPTSHGVVPTRALSRVSSFFFAAAYQVSSVFSLFLPPLVGPLTRPVSLSRALILFIFPRSCSSTTMWFDDLRSLRSSSVCYHTAVLAARRNASRNCSTESCIADPGQPACCFGMNCRNPI